MNPMHLRRGRSRRGARQPRGRRLALAFAAIFLAGVMAQAPNARGDAIIFHDLAETETIEKIGSADGTPFSQCPPDETTDVICEVILTRAGAVPVSAGGERAIAEDATLQVASDQFTYNQDTSFGPSFRLDFNSLPDGAPLSCVAAFGVACDSFETGAVQPLLTLHWSSGPDDVVQYQSDVEVAAAVPEPASALLLLTACATLLPYARRRPCPPRLLWSARRCWPSWA